MSVCLSVLCCHSYIIHLFIHLSLHPSIYSFIHPSIHPSIHPPSIYSYIHIPIHLYILDPILPVLQSVVLIHPHVLYVQDDLQHNLVEKISGEKIIYIIIIIHIKYCNHDNCYHEYIMNLPYHNEKYLPLQLHL